MFSLLDEFDIAAAQDPTRYGKVDHEYTNNAPRSFPQYNTGVVALNDTKEVHSLLNSWYDKHFEIREQVEYNLNQPSFREALYKSDLRIATLTSEYNFRLPYVGYASSEIRVLHGFPLDDDYSAIEATVNSDTGNRVVTKEQWPRKLIFDDDRSISYLLMRNIKAGKMVAKEHGWYEVIRRATRKITR